MDSDYRKLIKNGIEVFSVKTDAFTIRQDFLSIVHELFQFNSNIGGWRISKDCEVIKTVKPIIQFKCIRIDN